MGDELHAAKHPTWAAGMRAHSKHHPREVFTLAHDPLPDGNRWVVLGVGDDGQYAGFFVVGELVPVSGDGEEGGG